MAASQFELTVGVSLAKDLPNVSFASCHGCFSVAECNLVSARVRCKYDRRKLPVFDWSVGGARASFLNENTSTTVILE